MEKTSKQSLEFDFSSPHVLATLKRAKSNGTEFMGTATSDFQSHPHFKDKQGRPQISSDWEREAHKAAKKQTSHILGDQNVPEFPSFFENKELYIKRSAELGENMFRLSFDFGRLCPSPGEFNEELMAEYVEILGLIRDYGMEPMVTLYHWPTPLHLLTIDKDDKIVTGAWEHENLIHHFRFYIEHVISFLADKDKLKKALAQAGFSQNKQDQLIAEGLVRYFVSVNEPINLLLPTYILGLFPPFKKGRLDLIPKILNKVVGAHDIAITEIKNSQLKTTRGPIKVGAAHNWTYFEGILSKFAHSLINSKLARKFEREQKYTDFIGLHYYYLMKLSPFGKKHRIYGDNPYFGDIHPPGIYRVLKEMSTEYPGKEIFITEYGFSDKDDMRRPYWILETIRHVIEALEDNIPVKGMLLWTLVNNFEWNLGVNQKFGLFDEKELGQPLIASHGEHVRSWEAWQAAVKAITSPDENNLQKLQLIYLKAKHGFKKSIEA